MRLYDDLCRHEGDGPTVGLILCAEKNDAVARYSSLHDSEQLFAARYVTYQPTVEELQAELRRHSRGPMTAHPLSITEPPAEGPWLAFDSSPTTSPFGAIFSARRDRGCRISPEPRPGAAA